MFYALGQVPECIGACWQRCNLGAVVPTGIPEMNGEFWGEEGFFFY